MNRLLAILFLFAVATGSALADGPGVPKTTFTKAELYTVIGALSKDNGAPLAHGYLAMHRGYLVVVFTTDHGKGKGGFAFYDISDPRQPALVHRVQNELTYTFGEGHGYGFARYKDRDLVALQDGWGVQIWDWTDVKNPVQLSRIKLPPMSGGNYTDTAWWLSFQAPTIYVGGTNTGIHVVDASDPKNPRRVGSPIERAICSMFSTDVLTNWAMRCSSISCQFRQMKAWSRFGKCGDSKAGGFAPTGRSYEAWSKPCDESPSHTATDKIITRGIATAP